MRSIGLRRVTLNPVELKRVFLDPVNVNLGDQKLVNYDFSAMTIGAEVVVDPGFDNALDWSFSAAWSVSGGKATHDDGTSDNIQTSANVTTIGASYVATVVSDSITENGTQRITSRWSHDNYTLSVGTDTFYTAAVGSPTPQTPALRSAGSSDLGNTWVVDSFSVKPISVDSWPDVGTRSAAEYMIFDNDAQTVRIVSGGLQMGITQTIPDFVAGDWYYSVDIANDNLGSLKISTALDGDLATIDNTGEHTGVISLTDADIILQANGACDLTVCCFELYQVVS
jgi:hypothetical protein